MQFCEFVVVVEEFKSFYLKENTIHASPQNMDDGGNPNLQRD